MNENDLSENLRFKTGCFYSAERNKQIIIYLLKKYGIKKVVVSPGATNFALVGSMQHDPFFEMYSCVDERAAAYMAVGMSEKSKEPVVLSCTGATASRNYMPALTFAYKHNIPILVITSSLSLSHVGQLKAQVTDREHPPVDMIWKSYQFDNIKDSEDEWSVNLKCNEAINELLLNRIPVLINVCTSYSLDFGVKVLPEAKFIPTFTLDSELPVLPDTNICIFIGSHNRFSKDEIMVLERFCNRHNAVVMCDHTSGYSGKFKVNMSLPFGQECYFSKNRKVGLLIHIGEISGDYYTFGGLIPERVWRVNNDGAYSDFFKRLTAVFKMEETEFFLKYSGESLSDHKYFNECKNENKKFIKLLPEVPFSNIWIANQLHNKLPKGCQLHLGILNSLRSWNFFDLPDHVESNSNVGGFGIDGCVSTLIGAAIASPDKLFLGIVGDLTFYYDANILLNSKLPNNFRLLIINNGKGTEFRNYCHPAYKAFGDSVDSFVAAAGHFGDRQYSAIEELCQESNIEYLAVKSKEEFYEIENKITNSNISKPLIIECFTSPNDESEALRLYRQCVKERPNTIRRVKSALARLKTKLTI